MTMDHVKAYDDTVPIAVQAQESKRRKRRIMKIAVYFILGVIALGVFTVWLLHRDTVESLRFGSGLIFIVKLRSLEINNHKGVSVLYGEMGLNLQATPYDHCWDDAFKSYEDSCLYWRDVARMKVTRDDNSTLSCYTFQWDSVKPEYVAEDCFYLQSYTWFGYLANTTSPWPITGVSLEDVDYYVEYPLEQTEHLVPVWYGSQGVSIFVDSSYPFKFSWNNTDKCQFCITSKLKSSSNSAAMTLLRYTVCQGESVKDVYNVSRRHRLDVDTDFAFEQKDTHLLLSNPIYSLTTKEDLSELLNILRNNESKCNLIELFDDWEGEFGNLTVDSTVAENVQALLAEASRQDCYPILPISTFFSYKSDHFRDGVSNGYFVRDKQNLVTRMIRWRGQEGAVLDVTNPRAQQWFLDHTRRLIQQLGVRALKLLNLNIPPDSGYSDYNMTNLDYTRIFYKDMAALNISLVLELAVGFIPLPVYLPISMKFFNESGSYCLNMSIPHSLMMGMSGFPLLVAAADKLAINSTEEMFNIWLNVAIFFPVLEIPSTPFLKSEGMQKSLQEALNLRSRELLPYLTKIWEEEPEQPIIRPLWWTAPHDAKSRIISDQFLVGDSILVAPLLCERAEKRLVYLPEGTWHGYDIGSLRGPQTIEVKRHNISAIPAIPYFWKES